MCISILPENKKADISRRQNLIPPKKTSGSHCVRAKKKPPRQATNSKKVCYWRNSTPALEPILAQKSDPCTRACPKTLTPFHFLRFPPPEISQRSCKGCWGFRDEILSYASEFYRNKHLTFIVIGLFVVIRLLDTFHKHFAVTNFVSQGTPQEFT